MCYQSHFLLGVSFKTGRYQDQQFLNTTTNSWTHSRELAADGFLSESAGAASHRAQLFVFVAGIVRKSRLARFLRKVSTDRNALTGTATDDKQLSHFFSGPRSNFCFDLSFIHLHCPDIIDVTLACEDTKSVNICPLC